MNDTADNRASDAGVAILIPTQGHGFGAEAVLEELLRGWPASDPPAVVVSPANSRFSAVCRDTPHTHLVLPAERNAIIPNILAIRRVSPGPVRRVHAWSARAFEMGLILGRRLGVPVSGTLHDHPQAAFIGSARRVIMRNASARFSALGCVSQATLDACRDCGYRGALAVVHNGLCDFDINRTPATGQVRVGFLGMRAKRKGFDVLSEWVPALLENSDVVLKLYGEPHPEYAARVEALVQAYPGRVLACGHQPREDIFGEIDLLLHTAQEFEPFATVFLEAALAGLPCVASRAGGAAEAVVDGKTGLLYDAHRPEAGLQALVTLCGDAERRAEQGAAARKHYEDCFRIDRMYQAYQDLWRIR